MAWQTSNRASRLPKNWADIRRGILEQAHHQCQAPTHHPRCTGVATDVDHIKPGDDHTPANLQALSKECHDAKTARETAARNRARSAQRVRIDPHPGQLR